MYVEEGFFGEGTDNPKTNDYEVNGPLKREEEKSTRLT